VQVALIAILVWGGRMTRSPKQAARLEQIGATARACDVYDRAGVEDAVRAVRPDALIHPLTDYRSSTPAPPPHKPGQRSHPPRAHRQSHCRGPGGGLSPPDRCIAFLYRPTALTSTSSTTIQHRCAIGYPPSLNPTSATAASRARYGSHDSPLGH
jgi:hypothetical protein